jgi:hypothetical protein
LAVINDTQDNRNLAGHRDRMQEALSHVSSTQIVESHRAKVDRLTVAFVVTL